MDVEMETDEVNLSEDQRNIIQNMSSVFPKEVTANFFNVLRKSLPRSRTPKKQSTLDGWLEKSKSSKFHKTNEMSNQQNLPNTSNRSSEEELNIASNKQDSQNLMEPGLQKELFVELGNSNNAFQDDSSTNKESGELDSETIIKEPSTEEKLIKEMCRKSLTIELKRVEVGDPSVEEKLAKLSPSKKSDKSKNGRQKPFQGKKYSPKKIIFNTLNESLNETSTNDLGFGQDMHPPDLCEKFKSLDVDPSSIPKSKDKGLCTRKESTALHSLQDKKATSNVGLCKDLSNSGEKFDSLDVDLLPSPKKKKRQYVRKVSSAVNRKDGLEISDVSPAITDKTEDNSVSFVGNVNDGNSSLGQSSAVPTKIWIRKTRQTSQRLSVENVEFTCSLSNDADGPHSIAEENDDEAGILKSKTQNCSPADKMTSRRSRKKLKNGVDSDNKSTENGQSSLIDKPETVVIKQTGKRSRTLSKENANASSRTRQGSSPSNVNKNDVLESKSGFKISKKNKKSNQTSTRSEKPLEQLVSTERLNQLKEVCQQLNEFVDATKEVNDELSHVENVNLSSSEFSEKEEKSKAFGRAKKLTMHKKSNKKLETNTKPEGLSDDNVIEAAEIVERNQSVAEQMTKSNVNAKMTKKTKTCKNLKQKCKANKKLDDAHGTTDSTCREPEIMALNKSIINNQTLKIKRNPPRVATELSSIADKTLTEDAVLDPDLVEQESLDEDGTVTGLDNLPETEENENVDSSESNKLTVKVQSITRIIKATSKTNPRKPKRIGNSPRNSKLVAENPQVTDSTPNEVLSDLNQQTTIENETIPGLVGPPATEKFANSSITPEDVSPTNSSASDEKQKNFDHFCKLKEVCSSLGISIEQLFQNKKLTKQLKSPCKSDAYALINGHKFKNGQTVPSVFKCDSKVQFTDILQSCAAKTHKIE